MPQQIDVPGMGVVEFPDGMNDADIVAAIQKNSPKSEEKGSSLAGMAKTAATAPVRMAAGLAGMPADLLHLGMRALGDNLTSSNNYGSEAITKGVEGYTGPIYQPQGKAENVLDTGLQLAAPGLMGKGSIAAKLLGNVAAPLAASEAAGAVSGDNPYVKGAAMLGGAVLGPKGLSAATKAISPAKSAVTAEDTLKAASGQFKAAEDMNLTVTPDFAASAASKMRNDLKGFDPSPQGQGVVFGAADRLENLGKPRANTPFVPVEMNEVELIRQQLTKLKTNPDDSVREAARRAITSLQESQTAVTPAQVLRGDAAAYSKTMSDGIDNWRVGKHSNIVTGKTELADLNRAAAGAGADGDNTLRKAYKQLARPVNNTNTPVWQRMKFEPDEGALIDRITKGSPVGNTARFAGKYAPTGVVSAAGSIGLGHLIGGPFATVFPAVGYVAKKIGDLSTKKAATELNKLVLSKSPYAATVAQQLPAKVVQALPSKTVRRLQALIAAKIAGQEVLSDPAQPVNAGRQ